MREILFRGKNVDNGAWVYGSFIPDMLEVFCITDIDGFIKPFSLNKEELTEVRVERSTVGQFAGLTDKNGKKIFEHDIVRIAVCGTYDNYVISYDKENARFVVGDTGFTFLNYISTKIEVIGNIHDNPELLKE